MKTLSILSLAVAGLLGLASAKAAAAEPTAAEVATLPSVVHVNQTVVVETGHHHYYHHRHYYHRRYYWRHHRRYYY